MNYVISLVPIALYFILIKGMDGFSLAKWRRISECLIWGIFSCFLCLMEGMVLNEKFTDNFPIVEEIIKGLPLVIAIYKNRSAFFAESLIYGAAVGAGFSLAENILYVSFNPGFQLGDAILRGVGTSLLHIGCTALLATIVLVFNRIVKEKHWCIKALSAIAASLPAIVIHFVYNMFLLPEFVQMVSVVVIFIALFIILYQTDEKLIHKWLDLCISNDIALLTSMKKGMLQSTNAGKYLLMAKEKFQPDVFFDICVYLGLYLELSIAAKSRMIMKESGLEIRLSPEEHSSNKAKLTELHSLRSSIGTSGILLLRPFINEKAADEWAMSELL